MSAKGSSRSKFQLLEKPAARWPSANPNRTLPNDMMNGLEPVTAKAIDRPVEIEAKTELTNRCMAGEETREAGE